MAWAVIVGALLAVAIPAHASAAPGTDRQPARATGVINHGCGPNTNAHDVDGPARDSTLKIGTARLSLGHGARLGEEEDAWFATLSPAEVGDQVWLDWSDTPGSWHVCGPFTLHSGHGRWTEAVNWVSSPDKRSFRACGHHGGVTKYTGWV